MDDEDCSTCRFWEAVKPNNDIGNCHRYAPRPMIDPNFESDLEVYWPRTMDEDFCGEYQPRKPLSVVDPPTT
jgi:hypothetical protein